jgi:hypothetical protein
MIENEIKKKGVISAPASLDAAVLRHAHERAENPISWLDDPWLRFVAGYVPFLDWGLLVASLFQGETIQVTPNVPGLVLVQRGIKLGEQK